MFQKKVIHFFCRRRIERHWWVYLTFTDSKSSNATVLNNSASTIATRNCSNCSYSSLWNQNRKNIAAKAFRYSFTAIRYRTFVVAISRHILILVGSCKVLQQQNNMWSRWRAASWNHCCYGKEQTFSESHRRFEHNLTNCWSCYSLRMKSAFGQEERPMWPSSQNWNKLLAITLILSVTVCPIPKPGKPCNERFLNFHVVSFSMLSGFLNW